MRTITKTTIHSAVLLSALYYSASSASDEVLQPPEELLVTGKSSNNSLNLVSALSTLDKEQLEQANISHSRDLVKLAPSLSTLQSFNNRQSAFLIRGLGTLIFSSGVEPSVITMVDGVSLGSAAQSMMPLLDVSRVDIWRGPQITRFSRNAAAGVINVVSARAGEQWKGQIRMGVNSAPDSNSERISASAFVGGPLMENLGARFGLALSDTDGYIENVFDDQPLNNGRLKAFSSKIDWAASKRFSVAFDSHYSESNAHCCAPVVSYALSPQIISALSPVIPTQNNRASNTNTSFVNNSRASSARLKMRWQLESGFSMQATSAYSRYSEREAQDFDFLPADIIPLSAGYDTHRQFSQHLALYSPDDRAVSYSVGAYYERQRRNRRYERGILNIASAALVASIQKSSSAVYANIEANLNPQHTARVGVRHARNNLEFLANRDAFALQGLAALNNVSDSDEDTALDAEASWQYDISSTNLLYLRWSRGHKAPAYNIIFDLDANALEPVQKERGTSWELAYRHAFPAQQLMLNATLYHSQFNNYQAQVQEPGSIKFLLLNSGDIKSSGLELEAHWQHRGLQLHTNLDWTAARIGAVNGVLCGSGEVSRGECPDGFRNLKGESLPFAPDLKLNIALGYSFPTERFGMTLRADSLYRWQSTMQTSFNNDPFREQGAFGLWNLGLSASRGSLDLRLYVDNVLNKKFALAHFDNPIDAGGYVSFFARDASRIIGMSLNYSF